MSDVIDFRKHKEAREPHTSGEAICLHCRHTWAAVAPVHADEMECPSCGRMGGVWNYPFMPSEGAVMCGCGNHLFCVLTSGRKLCPACGTYSDWDG